MMRETTCVFIGHSDCFGIDKNVLRQKITDLIDIGVTEFLCGGMGGFDMLCANEIKSLQKTYPLVRCILVIPYLNDDLKYNSVFFEQILYPEYKNKYFKALITERNRYMVDNAAYAVYYILHTWGGAIKTFEYAKNKKLKIINVLNPL